ALAPPARIVHAPGAVRADVVPASLHAVEDVYDLTSRHRVDASELRAEASRVVRDFAARVGDLVVEQPLALALVRERDERASPEWHRPVAVERAPGVHAHRERRHLRVLAPAAREEVADRALDRGLWVVVPVDAQDLVAPSAGRRQPDVLDRAR